jgi:hypothetical protein
LHTVAHKNNETLRMLIINHMICHQFKSNQNEI